MTEELEGVEKDLLVKMYRLMLMSRMFDDKLVEMFANRQIIGMAPHAGHGQEAIGVGVCLALRKDDYIIPSHRGFAHTITKGTSIKKILADYCGRITGRNKGKGHISDPEVNNLGLTGVIGASLPIAAGVGWSIKIRKTDQVVVCFFGDGAASQADFYPALSLSAAWKLPVIWICENNFWAQFTYFYDVMGVKNIADLAKPFGIPNLIIDGNDVIAIYKAVYEAVKRARAGQGPTLIECLTYRWRPHYEGGPDDFRPKEEIEEWKKKCPIKRLENKLLEKGILTNNELDVIRKEVEVEIADAVKFALESPWPGPDELYTDVYA
jgi:pyruvate dehydrogenase E1 component alpha subunit